MKNQVQVYRNLTPKKSVKMAFGDKPVYSIKNDKGIVYDWATEVTLINPVFRVSQKGNERVRKEKRKNVHAYIQGKRMKGYHGHKGESWQRVTYNPYKHKNFVLDNDHSVIVTGAIMAHIDGKGVWVFKPSLRFENLLEV
jgi:hypothetical protein